MGQWQTYRSLAVPPHGYLLHALSRGFDGQLGPPEDRQGLHRDGLFPLHLGPGHQRGRRLRQFASLAKVTDAAAVCGGLIRPAGHNHNLQFLCRSAETGGQPAETYYEADENLAIRRPAEDRSDEVRKIAAIRQGLSKWTQPR